MSAGPPAATTPTGWPRAVVFAAGRDDPLARRPVDAARAGLDLLLLFIVAVLSVTGEDVDGRISDALIDFPGFLRALFLAAFWGGVAWALALLVITLVRRRPLLALACVASVVLGIAGAACVAALVGRSAGDVFSRLGDVDGPPLFPPTLIVATSAVLATLAPRLTLPFRRVGRGFLAVQVVAALFLGASVATGAIVAVLLGLLAGTTFHLLFGSPAGFPTLSRVQLALRDLGVAVTDLHAVSKGLEGSTVLAGSDATGPLRVKVYGRDAWEGEMLASAWRRVWYRGATQTARPSRADYVEHEGFMTFLAQRAGARVPEVVTAGVGPDGDALIAVRPDGATLADAGPILDTRALRSLWDQLALLHASGISHRRIDLDRVATHDDHTASFSDLASASVQGVAVDKLQDQAQLLALGLLTTGEDATVAQARDALGDDALRAVLPYVQEAVLPPELRSALRRERISLDDTRKRLSEALDASDVEIAKLRRVTWKSLLNLALLAVASYTLIGMLAGIDFGSFVRALGDANWWWLGAALVVGQLPRVANAVSSMGAIEKPVPLGPTTMMQFASCYVNLAVPTSAGRLALTTRFFQRFGVAPATALSASVIDSVSEFLVQAGLFVLVFFVSDVDLELSLSEDQLSGLATTALIAVVVLVVAAAVAFLVPALRARAKTALSQATEALHVLRSPSKLVQLFGGNLVSQLLFAVTFGMCVRAFGLYVPLTELILINTVVTLFAGLLPVPGGIGVTEGGLSLGLTRTGIPAPLALAIALSYRFAVFYLPPIWGYLSFKWLTVRNYL